MRTGGPFALSGGFWAPVTLVQTPGAPRLSLTLASDQSPTVLWPETAGWKLQQNTDLNASADWIPTTFPVTTTHGASRITVPTSSGQLFFRLEGL